MVYVDGQLRYEKKGDEYEIIYRYNNDGTLASVTRNRFSDGKTDILYAVTNTCGDVIELRSGSGAVNTVYTYDSWGKLISVTNASGTALASTNLGVQNSIRYRGYVYDTETGLYYLQSRYYDPEIARFLNADDVDFIGASGTVLGYNAFAYCENNVVNKIDVWGYEPYYVFSTKTDFRRISWILMDESKLKNIFVRYSYKYYMGVSDGRKYGVFYNYYTQVSQRFNYRQIERIYFRSYDDWTYVIDIENLNVIKRFKNKIKGLCGFGSEEMSGLIEFIEKHIGDDIFEILEGKFNIKASMLNDLIKCAEVLLDVYYKYFSKETKYIARIINQVNKKYRTKDFWIFVPMDILCQQSCAWSSSKWKTYKVVKYY